MRSTTNRFLRLASLAVVVTATTAARADSACLADAQRLCPGIPIGEGRVLTCLQVRWSEVSSACQQEVQAVQNRAREIAGACATDVWQYCQGVVPGGDRIRICLWARWDMLSSTCREEWASLAEKGQQLAELCPDDAARLCPGMKPGGGRIFLCLKAQESKVSNRCRPVLR